MQDYYQILGVQYDDPPTKIKARYRLLALEVHPDTGDTGRSNELMKYAKAYHTLGHAERRRRYNRTLGIFLPARDLQPGIDLYQRISITSEMTMQGCVVPLTFSRYEPCSLCWLSGCHRCNQQGMIPETISIDVQVSPLTRSGAMILVTGQGGCSEPGGLRGDLFIYVTIC